MCRLLVHAEAEGKVTAVGIFSRLHYQLGLSKTGSLSVEMPTSRRHAVRWVLRLEIAEVDNKSFNLPEQFLPTFLLTRLSRSSRYLFLSNVSSLSSTRPIN
jgi:hypothetical protein